MYAVERLGGYITRGVYTVAGPFHPFGGAVDIIVVEQPDGSFKSSPWYVRFGKFQGVLKAREKVVTINVNGGEANFHMFLDRRGEAHFLRAREEGEEESDSSYSSDEMDDQSQDSSVTAKTCSYNSSNSSSAKEFDASDGKIVAVTNSQQSRISRFVFGRRSMKEDVYLKEDDHVGVVKMSTLETADIASDLVETFMLDEGDLGGKLVQISETSRDIDESCLKDDGENENSKDVTSGVTNLNSQIPDIAEACPEKVDEVQAPDERDAAVLGYGMPQEDNDVSIAQSSFDCETSRSSVMKSDGLQNQSEEMSCLANGKSGDNHTCVQTLHSTAEPPTEDTGRCRAEDLQLEGKQTACSDMYPQQTNPCSPSVHGHDRMNFEVPVTATTSYTQTVSSNAAIDSNEVKSEGSGSFSGFRNSVDQAPDDNGYNGDSVQLVGVRSPIKVARLPAPGSSEEDQFFFSDFDNFEPQKNQRNSPFPDAVHKESLVQMDGPQKLERLKENTDVISNPISIPRHHTDPSAEHTRLSESLPNMWFDIDNLGSENPCQHLSRSLGFHATSLQLSFTNSDRENENQSPRGNFDEEDTQALEGSEDGVDNPTVGDPTKTNDASSGSWSLWPFPFKRARSKKNMQPTLTDTASSDLGNASASTVDSENVKKHVKDMKKMLKATTPTSDELISLNLNEGSNAVTFTFSTAMLGRQKVDARIYLWKWNTRIVISDVDGTITKSDVLGQFMPLVGIDWSQNGVVHLFSAIKQYLGGLYSRITARKKTFNRWLLELKPESHHMGNGYQFIYLSARSISQAYITRQFLVNLKQDGKGLPDGPVVISPDGLFPSLYREVIRRAPHEFKITCLEDIKALFPPDCSPFYAGFGNRDTDEISYLKVGIPKGKIFIINPKGEVAVNRLVDARSYTSLHALVHGMFPAMTSSAHVQEDYNSWNFWKLPPPHIDDI